MANQVMLISAAALLNDTYRRELRSTGHLRPMANSSDFIWQQMPLKYFGALVEFQRLNLRAYGEYSDYDEMKYPLFLSPLDAPIKYGFRREMAKASKDTIVAYYNGFEHQLYISCWYSSPDLSDVGFKTYAHNMSGIAIGTTVSKLREVLCQSSLNSPNGSKTPEINRIVCGNVQYVPPRDILERVIFDPAQTYAPIFTKGSQFQMDREFRVCIELSSGENYRYNSDRNVEIRRKKYKCAVKRLARLSTRSCASQSKAAEKVSDIIDSTEWPPSTDKAHIDLTCDPNSLIQFIALKDDGVFSKMSSDKILSAFDNLFGIRLENPQSGKNGFQIYKLKEILS